MEVGMRVFAKISSTNQHYSIKERHGNDQILKGAPVLIPQQIAGITVVNRVRHGRLLQCAAV
jgi:hypothetical protein